ncbi:MAG: hypothetical protein M0Z85_03870 [Gammaproteobacteria bacterium]|nr:hypothetical protein [Gammaproteobacteria bacterium]
MTTTTQKRHSVRGRGGRFTPAAPARNPNGELILPREYWDRPNRAKAADKRA